MYVINHDHQKCVQTHFYKVEAEKLKSRHNFKLNKMKGLSKNIWVQFFCIKIAMLMAIVLLVVLTSCGSAKNCHCNCDAYGQVSIDKDIKTTK